MYINGIKIIDVKRFAPCCYIIRTRDINLNVASYSFVNHELELRNIKSITCRGENVMLSFITNPQRMKLIENVPEHMDLSKLLDSYQQNFDMERQYDMLKSVKSLLKFKDSNDAIQHLENIYFNEIVNRLKMRYWTNMGTRIRNKFDGRLTNLLIETGACEYIPERSVYKERSIENKAMEKKAKRHRIFLRQL